MAKTFSQIYIQYVFAVKGRQNLLQKPWREEVFKYMAGIIKGKDKIDYRQWCKRSCTRICRFKANNVYFGSGSRH